MKNKQLRYFKSYLIPIIIGGVIALLGMLIYRYGYEIWVLGRPIMVVGVAIVLFFLAIRVSEANFQEYFNSRLSELPRVQGVELDPEYEVGAYSFENNHFAKIDKSSVPRSEIFVRTLFYFDKQLHVVRGVANMETGEEDKRIFSFAKATAAYEDIEIKVNGMSKKVSVMTVIGEDGSACKFPVKYNDIEIDQLVTKINERYGK